MIALALLLTGAAPGWHEVVVGRDAKGRCTATFDGKALPSGGGDDRLGADELKAIAGRHRQALLRAKGAEVPYRCIGAIIYRLQMAGYRLKFDFTPKSLGR